MERFNATLISTLIFAVLDDIIDVLNNEEDINYG